MRAALAFGRLVRLMVRVPKAGLLFVRGKVPAA
jgi:hypothetical protein